MIEITETIARKVLEVVDCGLVRGQGVPTPGSMCVEAAVCYAMGLPHGDDPECVAPSLRSLKIKLNDSSWSSNEARGKGLRRLAVAQLGSRGALDEKEFARRVSESVIRKQVPIALRAAASIQKDEKHKAALITAANKCEKEGTRKAALEAKTAADAAYDAAYAYAAADAAADAADAAAAYAYAAYAYAAAYAAAYADAAYAYAADAKKKTRDDVLNEFAEDVVQILIAMDAPGCQWLALTEIAA